MISLFMNFLVFLVSPLLFCQQLYSFGREKCRVVQILSGQKGVTIAV